MAIELQRLTAAPFMSKADPFLESLRGDAEFEALMRQVERRWKAFDA